MKKLLFVSLIVVSLSVRADVVDDFMGDILRRSMDVAKGSYTKIYLCVKGDLSDLIGMSHQKIVDRLHEIMGQREAAIKGTVGKIRSDILRFLGGKAEKVTAKSSNVKLGKVEQIDVKHGRNAAKWCLEAYADKLNPGDIISVVRNRDNHGIIRAKISYVAQVTQDRKGNKVLKKIAS